MEWRKIHHLFPPFFFILTKIAVYVQWLLLSHVSQTFHFSHHISLFKKPCVWQLESILHLDFPISAKK